MAKRQNHSKSNNYGQNFIYDENLLSELVGAVNISPEDNVLEIGAGAGTLTKVLEKKCKSMISVEIDSSLMPFLQLMKSEKLKIINADFLSLDLQELTKEWNSFKVVANIPYYITSDILHKLILSNLNIALIACMVQLEVAEKIIAGPKNKAYGVLSLLCQNSYSAQIIKVVPAACFDPIPKVDSAFVCLTKKFSPLDDYKFYKIIKVAFCHRRKTLVNSFKACGYDSLSVLNVLNTLGLKENVRAEEIDYEMFLSLAQALINLDFVAI